MPTANSILRALSGYKQSKYLPADLPRFPLVFLPPNPRKTRKNPRKTLTSPPLAPLPFCPQLPTDSTLTSTPSRKAEFKPYFSPPSRHPPPRAQFTQLHGNARLQPNPNLHPRVHPSSLH